MVASAMTRRGALASLGAFGLSLTGASGARAQGGLEIQQHRGQRRAASRARRRSDSGLDGAGARAGFASRAGSSSRARRQKRAHSRGPDRLDLPRPKPWRAGAEGIGAGHDHRKLPCSWTARCNRVCDPVASDRLLLSERRRPSARRASLSRAHCRSRADLRGLGPEGARASVTARHPPPRPSRSRAGQRRAGSSSRRVAFAPHRPHPGAISRLPRLRPCYSPPPWLARARTGQDRNLAAVRRSFWFGRSSR